MAQVLRETRVVEQSNGETVTRAGVQTTSVVAQIVYFIAGVITAILGLRFILALLGANPSNAFANFVYTVSHPLVAPFFGLFNYQSRVGVSRFEIETLVAIIVYALIAWGIVKLVAAVTHTNTAEEIE